MKVLKFGGSSVGNAENIGKVVEIVKKATEKETCIVVLSAMQGTTDALIEIGKLAENGSIEFREKIQTIEAKHLTAINELSLGDNQTVVDFVKAKFEELKNISEGIFLLGELSLRTLDKVVSFGEILSTKIVSEKLKQAGSDNIWVDSQGLIKTDSSFGNAIVDFDKTNGLIKQFVSDSNVDLYLFQGFIGSDTNGSTTTLGRGGSDYTGAIIAAAIDADVLEIWTDVSGMMTADPRFVRNVREIPKITYREAMELSHFGAKVIYPPTIQPVMKKNIAVWVKNTFAPDDYGTLIETEPTNGDEIIRGISSIGKICVLNLEGSGMVGIPGFSNRLFFALSKAKINVILITQSSSEHSICVAVEDKYQDLAKEVVDAEFEFEIRVGKIEPLRVETGLSILALVGDNMKSHTGIAGKMFSTLGHNGINILAIAQGSSERNISAIIESKDVRKAINTLHEEFFSDGNKQINLFIAGAGTVGSKLLDQIKQQQEFLAKNLRLNLRVIGLANSKKILIDEEGIDLENYQTLIENSEIDSTPQNFAELIIEKNLRNSIFVDITADSEIVEIYPKLLQKSVSIVACNKVAAASEYDKYRSLKDFSRRYNTNYLFETNVGAGLPVINTLNDLTRSGDKINRIEAVLSGTLQFVFNNYDGSRSFAEVVRQAQDEGYTEPDPRLDLSGTDVARKILILAREAGHKVEMSDVEINPFLPASCFEGSVEDFYAEMAKNEEHFKSMLDEAKNNELILKYIATFDNGKASVGLQSIDSKHDFANLSGKDNAILFYTNRYSEQPLVVKGAGAGADVTAAGVFADIIRATRA